MHDDRDLAATETAYVTAVAAAGGMPFVLPILDPTDAADAVEGLDAILFAGGGDIDPVLYGAVAAPEVAGVDRRRDLYELELLHAALERHHPVLGVCRGLQVINVALGGTLVQHLPDVSAVSHRDVSRAREPAHPVSVAPDNVLIELLGSTTIDVNTLHHQAVDVIGRDLVVAARAADGTVEALTSAEGRRLVGVQWHPELLTHDGVSAKLFRWLVEEACRATSVDALCTTAVETTSGANPVSLHAAVA
ncbi:MAG: putative glutamine amidotransferase [Acidimicrobiaceae bacterium]